MGLPILNVRQPPSRADLVRLFHRTEAMWVGHLAEAHTLDTGTAYCNPDLSSVWDANNIRDVALPPDTTPVQCLADVDAFYQAQNARCAYWVMNPSAPESQTSPLINHLLAAGYRAQADDILYLRAIPRVAPIDLPDVKVIPARASYRHAEQLAREKTTERWGDNEQLVSAALQDIDNPNFEAQLALVGDRAVATLGVLSVGDIGRIESVYVAKDSRRRGLAKMLMTRALEICARSLFRHVFILVEPANAPAQSLYASFGFEKIGDLTTYRAPSP